MIIGTTYQNIEINEFTLKREGEEYSVYFEFTSTEGSFKVKLSGVRDTYNLCDLLEAERIWIKEEKNSQIEYGRFTLGMSHESYSEFNFDVLY
ncbi:hypothetical protein OO007_19775 [Cocleimonas sp. KMM 6892]|uniref:hypothetical protein n=1 Tax=unclassified Cocleimonas TaxID=2639732 RepID=UPI002DB6816C|nr:MULTISPECIES: hypothetical protein [unclassified Cocleimonas]MEB8434487.1 hypothetical protein [Cocleimonas sp. KMM 6892]MEC4717380.1 hypothetical protein [Cocleimonas sp. KMM 6895]MEC4746759.1 hypothetical protein [Cocleimonas sp. KMM 6896]